MRVLAWLSAVFFATSACIAAEGRPAPVETVPAPPPVQVKPVATPPATTTTPVISFVSELPQVDVPRQLTLQRAQDLLLKNNLAIIAAKYGVDNAVAARIVADYNPNPQMTLGTEQYIVQGIDKGHAAGRNPLSHFGTDSGQPAQHTNTFRIDQPIELPNKKRYRVRAADFNVSQAEAQAADAVRLQMFQLKTLFYTAILARENLKVTQEDLATVQETEDKLRKNVQAGNIAESDLTRFQVGKIQFESASVSARLSYIQAVRDILNLISAHGGSVAAADKAIPPGIVEEAPIDVAGEFKIENLDIDLNDLRESVDTRTDVLAAKHNLAGLESALAYARQTRRPDFTVGSEYQRIGSNDTFGVVFTVPLPLWNNKQGEVRQAEAQLQQARTQLHQVQLQAMDDVDKAYHGYLLNKRLLDIYNAETINKAADAYRVARVLYEKGQGSRLDVLDAQRTYDQIRIALNQAHFAYLQSIFQLELATGKTLLK